MMDRWGTDTLPLAGEFCTITKDLMRQMPFNDTMSVGGRAADISRSCADPACG
jgi:polyhydroxyalkanoate synthase